MKYKARDIADHVGGEIVGDPDISITSLCKIEEPILHSLSFIANPKYLRFLQSDVPRTVLITQNFIEKRPSRTTFIIVENVYSAYADVAHLISESPPEVIHKISTSSIIADDVQIGAQVSIGDFSVIKGGVVLGDSVTIADQVFIGANVLIDNGTKVYPGVRIMDGVKIGSFCTIYPNAVIGGDGFGHVLNKLGHKKIAHHGGVIIEDNVEIGANTVIDRAAIGNTVIRKNVKLDNLIQVAHGVEIGSGTVIAAQSGISGSSKIGKDCLIGGQVGVAGHLEIASGSKIQGKSGIASNILIGDKKWYGYPVLGYFEFLRAFSIFKKLPEILKRLKRLEEK